MCRVAVHPKDNCSIKVSLLALLAVIATAVGGRAASAEDAPETRPLGERPALMARSRALSPPAKHAPQAVQRPAPVPSLGKGTQRSGTDDDSVRPIDPAGINRRP